MTDCCKPGSKMPLDRNEPLYIIELGAGSGKFSYFMLKALEEMKSVLDFPFDKIVYVMTDFTENNFKFWHNHPALKKYFESGRLDAAICNATEDREITLWKSGKVLGPGCSVNPICIVANYLFDTLYHDIFQVENNVLSEGLVSTGSKLPEEPDPLHPDIIQRLDNHYKYLAINTNYYKDEEGDELHFQRILHWYKDFFGPRAGGASFLLPVGALRALRRLTKFGNGRAIVLSGDKGNNHPEQFAGIMDPHIAVHGSFSLMVNYHAIGAWFTSKGGFALHNPQEEASLKVSCFVLDREDPTNASPMKDAMWVGDDFNIRDEVRSHAYAHLKYAFHESSSVFGPNDFFVLQKSIKEDIPNPPLRTVVSLLKLGDWDPDVFYKFRDVILNQAPSCGINFRKDLCRGIPKVWENYFIMDMDKDIAFEIGRFYYGIRDYAQALKFYSISKETVGDHHVTSHNQGLCFYSLGQVETSLDFFKHSMGLNGDYEKARSWTEKVTKELKAKQEKTDQPAADGESSTETANGVDGGHEDSNSNSNENGAAVNNLAEIMERAVNLATVHGNVPPAPPGN
jgi:tetratricopeptide (TPR) repeat protein